MSTKFINNTACPNQWRVSKATIIKRYISKHKIMFGNITSQSSKIDNSLAIKYNYGPLELCLHG